MRRLDKGTTLSAPSRTGDVTMEASTHTHSSLAAPTFLERSPVPRRNPVSRHANVRVLVAASGYIDHATSSKNMLRGNKTSAPESKDSPDPAEVIACSDSFVQIHTTYTDSKRFLFHKVFGSTKPTDGMFQELLPAIIDVANGINSQIIVSWAG